MLNANVNVNAVDSHRDLPVSSGQRIGATFLVTALFNTAIAGLLTTVGFGQSFGVNLVFSQCIGLTICLCVSTTGYLCRDTVAGVQALALVAALSLGALTGTGIGFLLTRMMDSGAIWGTAFFLRVVGISVLFGLIITYFFHSRQKLAASAQLLDAERIKRLAGEKQVLQADLKRLQAQIEPHFLFNTLSNILSLMDTDTDKAKQMQLNLIHYLRTSLGRTRDLTTTLGQEADLLRAYLEIFKVRMGKRLRYEVAIPADLRTHPFVPLLLQPLVENAVIHGVGPKIDGGRITIGAKLRGEWLRIEVADSGVGVNEGNPPGVGLTNVRERLENLFSPPGRLSMETLSPSGVRVVMEVPVNGMVSSAENRNHLEAAVERGGKDG